MKKASAIRCVIIDDEEHSVETLRWKINRFCPEVEVVQTFTDPVKGLEYLGKETIDLLFLDIEMPKLNGFDILRELPEVGFDVIFTTAYDEFGIKAIKFSALDYLLKPVEKSDLLAAIEKYKMKTRRVVSPGQLKVLFSNVADKTNKPEKVALATKESIEFVSPTDIVVCSSDSNYTIIHLESGRKKIVSRTLKDIEELLSGFHFFRVHNSHLVNIDHITEFVRSDGGYLRMSNKMTVPVARNRREELLRQF